MKIERNRGETPWMGVTRAILSRWNRDTASRGQDENAFAVSKCRYFSSRRSIHCGRGMGPFRKIDRRCSCRFRESPLPAFDSFLSARRYHAASFFPLPPADRSSPLPWKSRRERGTPRVVNHADRCNFRNASIISKEGVEVKGTEHLRRGCVPVQRGKSEISKPERTNANSPLAW